MAKVLLIAATLIDLTLAVLLVAVSGFITGSGPESMNASGFAAAAYWAAVVVCIAAPVVAFILTKNGRNAAGLAAAFVPPAGALAAFLLPAPY